MARTSALPVLHPDEIPNISSDCRRILREEYGVIQSRLSSGNGSVGEAIAEYRRVGQLWGVWVSRGEPTDPVEEVRQCAWYRTLDGRYARYHKSSPDDPWKVIARASSLDEVNAINDRIGRGEVTGLPM